MTQPVPVRSKPGIMRDTTRFDADQHIDGQWCRWVGGRPQKMNGYRQVTDSIPEISRGLHGFYADGLSHLHSGGATSIIQANSYLGVGSGFTDRTPALMAASPDNTWTFDVRYDPIINNRPMIIAHGAQALTQIDSSVETPVFWGDATAGTPLTPMAIPPTTASYTVLTTTGNTNSSTAVSGLASTAGLTKGMLVSGAGIPAGARITAVAGSSITLNIAATATASGVTLSFKVGGVSGGIIVLHPYVMTFGSNGKVGWTAPGDPNDFWSTGSGEAYVTSQKIVAGMRTRSGPGTSPSGLLWSLNSLVRVSFSGADTTFTFDEVDDGITILSPRSTVSMDGIYYWAGVDRFFMFSGTVRELPNPSNAQWFFDNINRDHAQKAFAFRNARWGEIWFCAPLFGATECSHAVIFNAREQCWYDTRLPNGGRSAAVPAVVTPYPFMMGVESAEGAAYSLWQHETGMDEVRDQTYAIKSYFETSDITLLTQEQAQDKSLFVTKLEPDFTQSGDMTVTVVGNYNARSPDVESQTQTIKANPTTDEQLVGFKETRRQMRFRFESNVAGGYYEAGKTLAHIAPADGRQSG